MNLKSLFGRTVALAACIALAGTALVPPSALAADTAGAGSAPTEQRTFAIDGVTYAVTGTNTVSVGTGKVGEHAIGQDRSGALVIPETVSDGTASYRVTSIAAYACTTCTSLVSVSIPASVTTIGYNAFAYCGTMDDSGAKPVYKGLSKVSIASGSELVAISENAFSKDYALEAFTFPASLESIGPRAFRDCFSFSYFKCEVGSHLRGIAARAFGASLPAMDPDSAASATKGPGVFPGGSATPGDDVRAGANVQSPGTPAQAASSSSGEADAGTGKIYAHLKSVELPASLKTLGEGAFENQRALTDLSWDDSCEMTTIGDYAFQYCTSLEEASVPAVTFAPEGLGPYSFQYCVNLKTFTYKGAIRAPYSGYSERGLFRGDTKLETVIYLATKYHKPHGTLTTIDTGRLAFTDSDPTVYYRVTFYGSKQDASSGTNALGSAAIRENTSVASINSKLAAKDSTGTVIYSGSIPELPAGYGWTATSGGGAVPLTDVAALYPAAPNDLSGGGIALSKSDFSYTGADCKPDVTVEDAMGAALDASAYRLVWKRASSDGTWSETADFVSPGTLRVSAAAREGSGYTGSTAVAEYTISDVEEDATFVRDGITYTVLTGSDSASPTVKVGDGEHAAISADTKGEVTIPAVVYPEGSKIGYRVTRVGTFAFGGTDSASACNGITSVKLSEGIGGIDASAFKNMKQLASVELPASLESVGSGAFANCESLGKITFTGQSVKTIGVRAFANCQSLTNIEFPEIAESFGSYALENCLSLSKVTFKGAVATTSANQFAGDDFLESIVFYGNAPNFALGDATTRYGHVAFETKAGKRLGGANIKLGTKLASIRRGISKASVISGNVPALPASMAGWKFSLGGKTLTAGATAVAEPMSSTFMAGSGTSKAAYKLVSASKRTVAYKTCKSSAKKATVPASVKCGDMTYAVTRVEARAFASAKKVRAVTVASKKIASFSRAFSGSKVATVNVPKSKKKAYAKLLAKKKCGRAVKVV